MLIAIDESGAFMEGETTPSFFIAVHLQESREGSLTKEAQLKNWELSIPSSMKSNKGEVKGSGLGQDQYLSFLKNVLLSDPLVGITSVAIVPSKHSKSLLENRRSLMLAGTNDAALQAAKLGRVGQSRTYIDLANHYRKLSYTVLLKIELLGSCIMRSIVNTVGRAVSEGFDNELVELEIKIDRDFVTNPQRHVFWREVLRNQLRVLSEMNPLPFPEVWKHESHPFIDKYNRDGSFDLNDLFVNHCKFVDSKQEFGVRIADVVASIYYISSRRNRMMLPPPLLSNTWNPYGESLIEIQLANFDLSDPKSLRELKGVLST